MAAKHKHGSMSEPGWLTLQRAEEQEVIIGHPESPIGRVRIAKGGIRGDRVRIQFLFPGIQVNRAEVAAQIVAQRRAETENS